MQELIKRLNKQLNSKIASIDSTGAPQEYKSGYIAGGTELLYELIDYYDNIISDSIVQKDLYMK